jgi:hypothetical protein
LYSGLVYKPDLYTLPVIALGNMVIELVEITGMAGTITSLSNKADHKI